MTYYTRKRKKRCDIQICDLPELGWGGGNESIEVKKLKLAQNNSIVQQVRKSVEAKLEISYSELCFQYQG